MEVEGRGKILQEFKEQVERTYTLTSVIAEVNLSDRSKGSSYYKVTLFSFEKTGEVKECLRELKVGDEVSFSGSFQIGLFKERQIFKVLLNGIRRFGNTVEREMTPPPSSQKVFIAPITEDVIVIESDEEPIVISSDDEASDEEVRQDTGIWKVPSRKRKHGGASMGAIRQ